MNATIEDGITNLAAGEDWFEANRKRGLRVAECFRAAAAEVADPRSVVIRLRYEVRRDEDKDPVPIPDYIWVEAFDGSGERLAFRIVEISGLGTYVSYEPLAPRPESGYLGGPPAEPLFESRHGARFFPPIDMDRLRRGIADDFRMRLQRGW